MARSIAICLEDLDPPSEQDRFLRCVALVGRQPGLRLGEDGSVSWQGGRTDRESGGTHAGPAEAARREVPGELWVSADDQLILYRPEGAAPLVVDRAGRRLDVPSGKPVVLLDGDRLEVGMRRLRVHVHGHTDRCHDPEPVPPRSTAARRLAAAVVAMGAAVASCEVRESPPDIEVASSRSGATSAPGGPPDASVAERDASDAAPRDADGDAAEPTGSDTAAARAETSSTRSPQAGPPDGGRAAAPVPKPRPPPAAPKPAPIEVRDFPPYM